jgi:hypothetical protein
MDTALPNFDFRLTPPDNRTTRRYFGSLPVTAEDDAIRHASYDATVAEEDAERAEEERFLAWLRTQKTSTPSIRKAA